MSRTKNRFAELAKLIYKHTVARSNQKAPVFKGQDHLGNKYYEVEKPVHWRPVHRYFEKSVENPDEVAPIDVANSVPPAWDAWLRFRRKDPPSDEEVEEAKLYYSYQQQLAAKKKAELESKNNAGANTKTSEERYKLPEHFKSRGILRPTVSRTLDDLHKSEAQKSSQSNK